MTKTNKNKVLLIIIDGWGLNKKYPGNAAELANTPYYDKLWKEYPAAVLEASGESVGLPEGQMGTSEVNHFTIGAGRVFFQDLVRINKAIDDDTFGRKRAFQKSFSHVREFDSTLHIIGLLSDGGVHSHQEHIYALVRAAAKAGVEHVVVHPITDGRDTSPTSGAGYLELLQEKLDEIGLGRIGSISGRYFAMDRDKNWDRTDKYFHMITKGKAKTISSAKKAIEASYKNKKTDEFVEPVFIESPGKESNLVKENDAVIFANFRNDRPQQITERFLEAEIPNLQLTTMTQYNPHYNVEVAFEPQAVDTTLGQIVSENNLEQLRITETEKFAHVTFFFNCKREEAYEGEDRFMFDSNSDIPTHDLKPKMKVMEIAETIVADIEDQKHDLIISNLCSPDMVGHTGNIPAAIKACETVNAALKKIVPAAIKQKYDVIITADHGNADEMLDEETGEVITSHSLNPVPLIVVSNRFSELKRKSGTLTDIAPTILTMLRLEIPQEMTGESFV